MRHAHPLPPLSLLLALLGLAACGEDGQSPTAPTHPRSPAARSSVTSPGTWWSTAWPIRAMASAMYHTVHPARGDQGPREHQDQLQARPHRHDHAARPGLGGGTLVIDKSLTITGPSAGIVIQRRSTDPAFRIVRIASGDTVRLTNLTLRNGSTDSTGGGLINFGRLTLTNCTVTGNSGGFLGGGIGNHGLLVLADSRVANNSGTGISNDGNLQLNKSLVAGNSRGGIYSQGRFTLANSVVSDNSGSGIVNDGLPFRDITGVISNSTIARNSADGDGGGIANDGAARLTVIKSTIADNSAIAGGGIYTSQGLRDGRGEVTIRNSTISGIGPLRRGHLRRRGRHWVSPRWSSSATARSRATGHRGRRHPSGVRRRTRPEEQPGRAEQGLPRGPT